MLSVGLVKAASNICSWTSLRDDKSFDVASKRLMIHPKKEKTNKTKKVAKIAIIKSKER